ncbi:hypothetical protein P153DRAFT_387022 [Dothidotthia symphoricarpi CBS 119687]|uniref:Uncharacterized protein n=1 Tax=Dothidotthia symphoricarpi CBS 119687 TaxID=1392245 RepID=A0A6A6A887_9PLEO|nr:uncharacterized protein P153DRAFT_387022 [Dothidotthia symphoricarpi CBS 119687]KAF2128050.1 hypothetical protein P153DRAFT_387022 [Dothidotthia symphoricarpi CBS 119687]
MLRVSLQATRACLKQSKSAQVQPLSTASAPEFAMRTSQAVNEFQAVQPSASKTNEFLSSSACKEASRQSKQIIWLAKHSLRVASATETSNAINGVRSMKDSTTQGFGIQSTSFTPRSLCAEPWDGPTIWAHLW